jgi:AcrR family transcriptional regulator
MASTVDSEGRRSVVASGMDPVTPQALRDAVIDAALRVIQERGLARTRTSHIARAAGCSEGSIYRYFSGKSELVHEVIRSRLLTMIGTLGELPMRAGTATVQANLLEAARAALASYGDGVMLLGGLFADAELLAAEREFLASRDVGPHAVAVNLAAYLKAEQRLGRVRPTRPSTPPIESDTCAGWSRPWSPAWSLRRLTTTATNPRRDQGSEER